MSGKKSFNQFYSSAFPIMQNISTNIVNNSLRNNHDIMVNIMFFAIGVEKLLKGVIFDVNPLFVLEKVEFNNAVQVFYSQNIKNKDSKFSGGDDSVIAMTNTIFRTVIFSHTVSKYKNTLFKIRDIRDTIAHGDTNNIDWEEVKRLLQRDFYPLLKEFSDEHSCNGTKNFFNNQHIQLAKISSNLQETVEAQVKMKVDAAAEKWRQLESNPTFKIINCQNKTINELRDKNFAFVTKCPACSNDALIYTTREEQFDVEKLEMRNVGFKILGLHCLYCSLSVNNYSELDQLKINFSMDRKQELLSDENDLEKI